MFVRLTVAGLALPIVFAIVDGTYLTLAQSPGEKVKVYIGKHKSQLRRTALSMTAYINL